MIHLSRRDLLLLVGLTLAWGINWPVMKSGVRELPPFYFRTLCMAGGLVLLWAWARWHAIPLAVPRRAWRDVLRLAVPNMIVWHLLAILAVKMLPAGRSAILGYTMPVWAVLFGLLVFREPVARRHLVGVGAALAGTLLLLSAELADLAGRPLGAVLMLVAAAAWGYGTHLMRRHLGDLPTLTLTFWMLALACAALAAASIGFERDAWRMPDAGEWAAIAYNMAIAIAFCHVAWAVLARTLPPAASGLSVMMIPVVGVFSSMAMLGEQPGLRDLGALALILVALGTVLWPARRASASLRPPPAPSTGSA